jgi:hypothetical protein
MWMGSHSIHWPFQVFIDFYKLPEAAAPTGMRGMLKRLRRPTG